LPEPIFFMLSIVSRNKNIKYRQKPESAQHDKVLAIQAVLETI